jgi:hypothetical protein
MGGMNEGEIGVLVAALVSVLSGSAIEARRLALENSSKEFSIF